MNIKNLSSISSIATVTYKYTMLREMYVMDSTGDSRRDKQQTAAAGKSFVENKKTKRKKERKKRKH